MKHMVWWRWLAGTFVIISIWFYGAALVAPLAEWLFGGVQPWQALLRDLLPFLPFFVATPVVWRLLTGTPVSRLITARGRIDVGRLGYGFLLWFLLTAVTTGVDIVAHPSGYRFTFDVGRFVPFAMVAVLLLPAQTWAEEFFFRAWIIRWAASLPPIVRSVLSGVIFALPHLGNPEAVGHEWTGFAAWFLLGFGWAYASVRDGGIEVAMGAHLANNAFALLFVGYDGASLPTSAILTASGADIDGTLLILIFMVPLFLLGTSKRA